MKRTFFQIVWVTIECIGIAVTGLLVIVLFLALLIAILGS
jgi:hypothetical protein